MSSDTSDLDTFRQWYNKIQSLNIRALIFATPEHEGVNRLRDMFSDSNLPSLSVDCAKSQASTEKADTSLGGESKAVFFDASIIFDPNSFASVSGTLVGGGILILLINDQALSLALSLSGHQPGPSIGDKNEICPLLDRVIRYHANNRSTAILSDNHFYISKALFDWQPATDSSRFLQQNELVEKIIRVAKGHANRPLVITANRGRGKSAALGIAASHILEGGPHTILITAPRFQNLTIFYQHLLENSPDLKPLKSSQTKILHTKRLHLNNGSKVIFLPPDEVIRANINANLLMVDEAAAIPVSQLVVLSQKFNRIVFATTSYGYEGNGKGFEVRFKKHLLQIKPGTRFATLDAPIRWAEGDELETSTFKALLLDCSLEKLIAKSSGADIRSELALEMQDRQSLNTQESDLRNIFSLLVNAHYQTRPADLQTILSQSKVTVWTLRWKNRIAGVALISHEGNLKRETSERICNGELRLKGELLPQSLLAHFGINEAGDLSYYRVMRIAIHPEIQNKGLGSYLLTGITEYALSHKISFIGASFAATTDVVNFWTSNGFTCTRFGNSKDSSSGAYSLEVLKPLSAEAELVNQKLKQRFNDSFLMKLHGNLKALDVGVISRIILTQLSFSIDHLTDYERHELHRFIQSKRGFSMIDDLAVKLFKLKLPLIKEAGEWTDEQITFLVDCLFIQSDFPTLATRFKLQGKKQALSFLRSLVEKLLSTCDNSR